MGQYLTEAQLHGFIRWVLTGLGVYLVKRGFDQGMWNSAEPYIEAIIGAVFSLGSLGWNYISHSPSGIAKHLNALKNT